MTGLKEYRPYYYPHFTDKERSSDNFPEMIELELERTGLTPETFLTHVLCWTNWEKTSDRGYFQLCVEGTPDFYISLSAQGYYNGKKQQ